MPIRLSSKIGFEIELLAPPNASRRDLAERVARKCDGTVRRFFHPQSEPSKVPGQSLFENLTLGFEVRDTRGAWVASFVDDLTLQADLDRQSLPCPGWYRIVADDARILRLAMRHCDAGADSGEVLGPLAALFGTEPQLREGDMVRIVDDREASVAICAPLPGERERPCEIVTAPIERAHGRALTSLLSDARRLGFALPREGATHIHFDASPLCSAGALSRFISLIEIHGDALRTLVGVNPHCIRLGRWPSELLDLVQDKSFVNMPWPKARNALAKLPLTKYCDYNLCNLVNQTPDKHTLEIRILPSSLDADFILSAAALFEGILKLCCAPDEKLPAPEPLSTLIARLPITESIRAFWTKRARAVESVCLRGENLYAFDVVGHPADRSRGDFYD